MIKSRKITFLDSAQDRWILVGFCALFGSIFMVIYNPLAIQNISIYSWLGNALTIKLAAVVGAMTVAFNQFVIRPLLKIKSYTPASFIAWVIFDMMMITLVIFVIYKEYKEPTFDEYLIVTKYAVGIALPPYLLACLMLVLKESRSNAKIAVASNRPIPTTVPSLSDEYWKITDTNNKQQLIVRANNLLYIESNNNYIDVSFIDGEEVKKKSIRNTLKNLEQDPLAPSIIRVHRSYMVNLEKISHINRQGPKWTIKLSHVDSPEIPISTSYQKSLELAMA